MPQLAPSKTQTKRILIDILLIVILAVAVRIVFALSFSQVPLSRLDLYFKDSDMYGNAEWALKILSGDFWGLKTWHPYHPWMIEIAPKAQWNHWWGGEGVLHQAPGYPYLLSLLFWLSGFKLFFVKSLQQGIGVLSAVLLYLSGSLLFGRRTGFISGVLASLYFPFLCFEYFLLRDFLAVHAVCLMLLIFVLARKKQSLLGWFLSGIALGGALLIRENFLILLPFAFILPWAKTEGIRHSLLKIFTVFTGLVLILCPLFIRNHKAGIPMTTLSNRLIESLIEGNAYDSLPTPMCLPESMGKYLKEGEGQGVRTLLLIIKDYPTFGEFILRQFSKMAWLISFYEPFDNVNTYFIRKELPWTFLLPDFAGIYLLGFGGLWIYFREKERFIWYFFLLLFLSLLLAPVIGRYRLILFPFFLLWSALSVEWLILRFKGFRLTGVILGLLVILCGIVLDGIIPKKMKERDVEPYYVRMIEGQLKMDH